MVSIRRQAVAALLAVACTICVTATGMSTPDRNERGSGTAIAIGKGADDLAALETKLLGNWRGDEPCSGSLDILPGGKYERKMRGPGGDTSTGTWALRWNALPPTLVLTCKTSDDPDEVGKIVETKIVELDDAKLAIKDPASTTTRFSKAKK